MASGKILVAQGGGPTAVIDRSLVGVVHEARRFREVTRVCASRHGVRSVINKGFVDLTQESSQAREVGEKAVQFASWQALGGNGGDDSVAIQRSGAYAVDCTLLPQQAVAGKTRTMKDPFIADSGPEVTEAIGLCLRPLPGSGMPDTARLRAAAVPRQPRT